MSDVSVRLTLQDDASSKLSCVSSTARTASQQLQQMGQQIDKAFETNSPEQFASKLGSAMDTATDGMETLGDSVEQAMRDMERGMDSDFAQGFENAADGASNLAEAAEEAGESVDSLSESTESLGKSVDGIDGGESLGDLGEQARGAGEGMGEAEGKANSLTGALKKLFAVISLAAALHQVAGFASDSIDLGKNYTAMISEVQAISGASESEMAKLETTAREYGATTVFSATEAAEALKYMSLAGWDASQSSSALGGVLDLAAASGMGLGQASDMVTDYLSAFGMEANQATYFADLLSFAQSNSNTTAEQLGEAYRNSAANMHAAGQDVETTTSLLEAMANQGYKGSEAGTALAAAMRDITQKMDDGAIKIGDTSVAVQDAHGNFRDLTDILTDVEKATDGMGDAQKAAALGETFTADSIKALNMILTEGMDKISGYEDSLRHAGGTASDMAGIMNDNLTGDMANMNSAFEEMQLQVYEQMEEPLREGVQYITSDVIPALTEWVPEAFGAIASGASKLGNALKPLFETILKNPQAVAKAFTSLGAGFVAMKGVSTAMSIGKSISDANGLVGALSKVAGSLFSNPWAAGAAGVVAAVGLVATAVSEYNKLQVNESLEAHFGNITLDDSQIQDFASRVINAEWIVNINTALGHFENADNLAKQAEEALAENDALEWKARVGIELTAEEQETYTANIEEFAQARIDELEERTYAAELTVSTMLKSPEGESLADAIGKWAAEDMAEVSTLQAQLTNLVETALTDGIIDVNEQAAIDILQSKINNILSGWKASEAQAEMDLITQQYGRLSGKDLTSETFTSIVEALGEQRKSAAEALEADSKEFYGVINGLMNSGRLSQSQGEDYKQQFVQAVRNSEAGALVNSLNFEGNTLSDTYGEKLQQNYASMQKETASWLESANNYLANEDYGSLFDSMQYAYNSAMVSSGLFSGADQKALADRFSVMKPDVEAMGDLIDEYRNAGQAVPKEVMTAFNEAMQIGAAAGDVDAAWATFAQQMVADPASAALVQAIQDGTVTVPEELRTAIGRAAAETTDEPVTIDGMTAELQNIEVDNAKVQELLDRAMEGVEATGETKTLPGGEIAVEYEVTAGQTLSEIAAQAGMALNDLLAANPDIENPDIIQIGQKILIPADKVDTDTSGVGQAVQEATAEAEQAAEAASTPIETTQEVNTTYEKGEEDRSALEQQNTVDNAEPVEQQVPTSIVFEVASLDDSALASAISEKLGQGDAVPVTVPASITVEAGSITSDGMLTAVQGAVDTAFGTNLAGNGIADVTLEKGTDNVAAIYSQVGGIVQGAWSQPYSASGIVNVVLTANYSLANPTKTISFGGGATGSATVSASLHAAGGYFDTPHIGVVAEAGVGEYIIPMDGSGRSIDMWKDAGQMLGVLNTGNAGSLQPVNTTEGAGRPAGSGQSGDRTIKVEIAGNGSINVSGGGMSKEKIVDIMLENMREVFMNIVQQEIIEEGEGTYEF